MCEVNVNKEVKVCHCGCGQPVKKNKKGEWNKYILQHHHIGKHHTEETKRKIGKASLGHILSDEAKRKIGEANKGRKFPKEFGQKISQRMKGKQPRLGAILSEESKKKISKAIKNLNKDPKYRKRINKGLRERPTRIERQLQKILNHLFPKKYKYVGDGKLYIGSKNPDFVHTKERKAIEMFGMYWHSKKRTGLSMKTHRKQHQRYMSNYGYSCCVVWECELNNLSKLEERLKKFNEIQTIRPMKRNEGKRLQCNLTNI